MIDFHRYVIANAAIISRDDLCVWLQKSDMNVEFDHEVVLRDGVECGILVDVLSRGSSVFDDHLLAARERVEASWPLERATQIFESCQCMLTVQATSMADEACLEAIWNVVGARRKGLLVLEDHTSTIRYYD